LDFASGAAVGVGVGFGTGVGLDVGVGSGASPAHDAESKTPATMVIVAIRNKFLPFIVRSSPFGDQLSATGGQLV